MTTDWYKWLQGSYMSSTGEKARTSWLRWEEISGTISSSHFQHLSGKSDMTDTEQTGPPSAMPNILLFIFHGALWRIKYFIDRLVNNNKLFIKISFKVIDSREDFLWGQRSKYTVLLINLSVSSYFYKSVI